MRARSRPSPKWSDQPLDGPNRRAKGEAHNRPCRGGGRMTFADKLRAVRKRERYSQATAAELVRDLSVRTLQEWEHERQTPPLWAQWLVLEALGGAPYVKPKVRRAAGAGRGAAKASNEVKTQTQNDRKLSDCGGRRSLCGKVAGAGLRVEAQAVTPGAVRCSAWLGVSGLIGFDGLCAEINPTARPMESLRRRSATESL